MYGFGTVSVLLLKHKMLYCAVVRKYNLIYSENAGVANEKENVQVVGIVYCNGVVGVYRNSRRGNR